MEFLTGAMDVAGPFINALGDSGLFGSSSSGFQKLGSLIDMDRIRGHPMGRYTVPQELYPATGFDGGIPYDTGYAFTERRMNGLNSKFPEGMTIHEKPYKKPNIGSSFGNLVSTIGPLALTAFGLPEFAPVATVAGELLGKLSDMFS